jgi:hypothetical protein
VLGADPAEEERSAAPWLYPSASGSLEVSASPQRARCVKDMHHPPWPCRSSPINVPQGLVNALPMIMPVNGQDRAGPLLAAPPPSYHAREWRPPCRAALCRALGFTTWIRHTTSQLAPPLSMPPPSAETGSHEHPRPRVGRLQLCQGERRGRRGPARLLIAACRCLELGRKPVSPHIARGQFGHHAPCKFHAAGLRSRPHAQGRPSSF